MMASLESIAGYLALNTLVFHGREFERAFAMTAEMGFEYIEPAFIKSYYPNIIGDDFFSHENGMRFRSMASRAGLKVKSVGVHFNMGNEPDDADQMTRRLDFAKGLGAGIAITNGAVRNNLDGFLHCIENVTPVLEKYGLILALENPGCGEPDSILATGADGASLLERLDNPHVKLNYDASNVYSYSKGSVLPENDFQNAAPYLACLHLKQLKKSGDRWLFSALGDGISNFEPILKGIRARSGIPYMSLELPINHMRDDTLTICKNTDFETSPERLIKEIVMESASYVAGIFEF